VSERRIASESQYQQPVRDDQHETPTVRVIHYRPEDAPTRSTMDTDHYLEIVEMQTESDQESTTDTDHYDRPELPYEGLDGTTVTPRVVVQQPSVYEGLTP